MKISTSLLFECVLRRRGRPQLAEWRQALKGVYSKSPASSKWLLHQVTAGEDGQDWLQKHLLTSRGGVEAPQTFCFAIQVAMRSLIGEYELNGEGDRVPPVVER